MPDASSSPPSPTAAALPPLPLQPVGPTGGFYRRVLPAGPTGGSQVGVLDQFIGARAKSGERRDKDYEESELVLYKVTLSPAPNPIP